MTRARKLINIFVWYSKDWFPGRKNTTALPEAFFRVNAKISQNLSPSLPLSEIQVFIVMAEGYVNSIHCDKLDKLVNLPGNTETSQSASSRVSFQLQTISSGPYWADKVISSSSLSWCHMMSYARSETRCDNQDTSESESWSCWVKRPCLLQPRFSFYVI